MSSKMVLVPATMHLDRETIGAINFHCGDGADGQFGEYSHGLLWVGAVTDDDGKEVYGLHLATAEYPEEGSTTLVEFAAPVVERQPLIHITPQVLGMLKGELRMQSGGITFSESEPIGNWTIPLYTAPPELAELQATIARLRETEAAYEDAMNESNELGFAGMNAGDVVRHQAEELTELREVVTGLEREQKNDAIAYKAAIEKQGEIRSELAGAQSKIVRMKLLLSQALSMANGATEEWHNDAVKEIQQ